MTTIIRNIEKEDYRKVEEMTREAFWNLYVPGCSEHLTVERLVNQPDFIPELSFVLERDKEIIGSIFYSRCKIVTDMGETKEFVSFGPVSILPKYQQKGYGKQLITHSIAMAKRRGAAAVIIGGYPNYYQKYGFVGIKKYGISLPDKKYYTGIMALPLKTDGLAGLSGSLFFSEAMSEPDNQEVKVFERKFAPKEKRILPSQHAFTVAVSEIDERTY